MKATGILYALFNEIDRLILTSADWLTNLPSRNVRIRQDTPPCGRLLTIVPAKFQWMRGELLGKGSYGKVYLALNATTGEIMAVKQVELPKTASEKASSQQMDVMRALKFESDTLSDLDHPNIVSYLGFEESADYLSM